MPKIPEGDSLKGYHTDPYGKFIEVIPTHSLPIKPYELRTTPGRSIRRSLLDDHLVGTPQCPFLDHNKWAFLLDPTKKEDSRLVFSFCKEIQHLLVLSRE